MGSDSLGPTRQIPSSLADPTRLPLILNPFSSHRGFAKAPTKGAIPRDQASCTADGKLPLLNPHQSQPNGERVEDPALR